MYGFCRSATFFLIAALTGCGMTGNTAPEGFSPTEWRNELGARPGLAQAHRWIDRDPVRRKQRGLAVAACYRAFAFSHTKTEAEDFLADLPRRKGYYHQINSTWLPEVALKAQRGEGGFGPLLAQELEAEAQRCWNPKSGEVLRGAAQKIRAL